jgi:hypothetical protein
VLGPGFFFAPWVPAVVAATITLVGMALVSFATFVTLERAVSSRWPDRDVRRQRMLAFASFAAFNLFYLFAGAPTLRLVPGIARALELVVPVVATLVLVHRLRAPATSAATAAVVTSATSSSTPSARERRRLPVLREVP